MDTKTPATVLTATPVHSTPTLVTLAINGRNKHPFEPEFRTVFGGTADPELTEMLDDTKMFARDLLTGKTRCITFTGTIGCGKSYLASQLFDWWKAGAPSQRYTSLRPGVPIRDPATGY